MYTYIIGIRACINGINVSMCIYIYIHMHTICTDQCTNMCTYAASVYLNASIHGYLEDHGT